MYMTIKKKIILYLKLKIRGEMAPELLIERGMKIGKNSDFGDKCVIDQTFCWLISIGENVTVSNHVSFIAHDASFQYILGYTKIGKIIVENNVFIGARSLILPGVTIGESAIVAAGSVITKDIPPFEVWGGNPAKKLCDVYELGKKYHENISFDSSYYKDRDRKKYAEVEAALEKSRFVFIH